MTNMEWAIEQSGYMGKSDALTWAFFHNGLPNDKSMDDVSIVEFSAWIFAEHRDIIRPE